MEQLATAYASVRTTARVERNEEAKRQRARPTFTFANGKKVALQPSRGEYAISVGK